MINKINKLSRRHNKPMLSSLGYEMFIRVYRYFPIARKLLRFFSLPKQPKNIFFVVGAYNSGTTITKSVIGLHPSVSSAPIEGDLLTSEISNLEENGWHRCLYGNKESILDYRKTVTINPINLIKDWSPWIKKDKFFLEKSVSNSVRMSQLREAFPGSKFINVIRDPHDVTSGIIKRSKPTGEAATSLNSDAYPEKLISCQWSFIYDIIDLDSRDADTFSCSYENFIKYPVETISAIYSFLNLHPIAISFNHKTNLLQLGEEQIYLRPLSKNHTEYSDFSNKDILKSKIKELRCA